MDDSKKATAPSGANAPYKIVPVGKKFVVRNNAGETKATFDDRPAALDYLQALYANVKGASKRAGKVPFTGKAKNRVPMAKASCDDCPREFVDGAAFLTHVQTIHPERAGTALLAELALDMADALNAEVTTVGCLEPDCDRAFLEFGDMVEHAEAVHTFDDIRRLVSEKVRATFGRKGDYTAKPIVPSIYTWVVDLSTDWVVFQIDDDSTDKYRKATYTITGNEVTLGSAVSVVRKTVYEPIDKENA